MSPQEHFEFFIPKNFPKRAAEAKLSPRETEIARLIVTDEKNESIAGTLGISVHTVDNHIRRIYRKLGFHSRIQLVIFFLNSRQT
jgi:DNA-binding NarL/FixJ family response regulator